MSFRDCFSNIISHPKSDSSVSSRSSLAENLRVFGRPIWILGLLLVVSLGAATLWNADSTAAPASTRPVAGIRDKAPKVHALVGARLVIRPGQVIEKGTLVIRDGAIVAIGAEVEAPSDARVWDVEGKTIYPGLIDSYSEISAPGLPSGGAPHWNSLITPQRSLADTYSYSSSTNSDYRSQGVTARLVAPDSGILKGQSVLVTTADGSGDRAILRRDVAQHVLLTVSRTWRSASYPNSPMGAVALARQTMYDADWHGRAWKAYEADRTLARPERNDALASLAGVVDGQDLAIVDGIDEQYLLRADRFAREFGLNIAIRGSGREYRRLDAVRATGRTLIVPVNFPKAPNVATPESAADATLRGLMHWDIAPENPARLAKAGVPIALTAHGLKSRKGFLSAVRKAVERGLKPDAALAALTTTPAELLGASDQLGTLEVGKLAHLVVTDGDLFEKKTKITSTWVDGRRHELVNKTKLDLRGDWDIQLASRSRKLPKSLMVTLSGKPEKLRGTLNIEKEEKTNAKQTDADQSKASKEKEGAPEDDEQGEEVKKGESKETSGEEKESKDETIQLNRLSVSGSRLVFQFDVKPLKLEGKSDGVAQVSATITHPPTGPIAWTGAVAWPDGSRTHFSAQRVDENSKSVAKNESQKKVKDNAKEAKENAKDEGDQGEKQDSKNVETASEEKTSDKETLAKGKSDKKSDDLAASYPVNYPLGAFGVTEAPKQADWIALTGATIWTCEKEGVLENATLLLHKGKIAAVGVDVEVPAGAKVVDMKGQHITPGIIDCHSHMATDGGVNESGQAITAEVRIGDFIDAADITMYRQLAGGVTTSNILHGSANPIGGQNQVIKLRWGLTPEEMKMSEAPQGIKFALGENVKQSNRGSRFTTRYPQTRMGVEQLIQDAFQTAKEYRLRQKEWDAEHRGAPPRRDLELDAIAEILEGKRWIHCHSYRQDEILALLRVLESYDIQIGSLQHILEGYKVADAMAKHGAMGSSFSDWWAYKFEVYDAIPYNGALMHKAGVVVSFNSDDRELATHLNQEASKAVKYGGVAPVEALKFVTLNPAKQLRIDEYVGSLAPGKQADLAIWNGPPLSNFSRCEQTWIDGRKYFDRAADEKLRKRDRAMHAALVQKVIKSKSPMRSATDADPDKDTMWPREDIFCHGHDEHGHGSRSHSNEEHREE